MKTLIHPVLKSKTYSINKSYTRFCKKENTLVDFKFYQKLFVVLISFSTFLILPEHPRELENLCEKYNAKESCHVW